VKKTKKIKISSDVSVELVDLLYKVTETCKVKDVIRQLCCNCMMESGLTTSPLMGLIASETEVENLLENTKNSFVLTYVIKHWDEIMQYGKEELERKMCEKGNT
jgi:hypothetical protein